MRTAAFRAVNPRGGGGGQLTGDFGAPIHLWSHTPFPNNTVKYSDVSFSGGLNFKYFWNANAGILLNLQGTSLLAREYETQRGFKGTSSLDRFKQNFGLSVIIGPVYRIAVGPSANFYIGIGPRYTLEILGIEDTVPIISRTTGAILRTAPRKLTYSFHTLGLAVEPGIAVNLGTNIVFDAGLGLSFNFLRSQNTKAEVGSRSDTRKDDFKEYFGFTISPHIGLGYSF